MQHKLKILLSAYACEPNKGSEPGVGWNWAIEIAKLGHEVWVLTRENNKKNIINEQGKLISLPNLHFIYYDLPPIILKIKKFIGIYLYYFLWQHFVVKTAKEAHKDIRFDVVHHITFGVFRQPSKLWKLKIPFVFGPIGGGEKTPFRLRKKFGLKNWLIDLVRDIINSISQLNPSLYNCYSKASLIFTKTKDTFQIVPRKFHSKTHIKLEIGINKASSSLTNEIFTFLFVGRFLYWKGAHLALEAFYLFQKEVSETRFVFIGEGPFKDKLGSFAKKRGIQDKVVWFDWVNQDELNQYYLNTNVFVFPSLHDSSGNAVLEALSFGIPVICLDLGGPGQIVNNSCGRVINTKNKNEQQVINDLTKALEELYTNPVLVKQLSLNAIKRSKEFEWSKIVKETYNEIEHKIFNNELKKDV